MTQMISGFHNYFMKHPHDPLQIDFRSIFSIK